MSAIDESPLISGPEVLIHLTGTDDQPLPCILVRTAHGKMHISTSQWIEPASRVSATFAHITLPGEVVYCTRKDNGYWICISLISGNDQRREPRIPVRQPGTIIVLSGEGSESSQGTLLDLSASGVRLEMSYRVETGTMIFFLTESTVVVGEVRHCDQRRRSHFEAGVEITDILSNIESQQMSRRGILKEHSPEARSADSSKSGARSSGS